MLIALFEGQCSTVGWWGTALQSQSGLLQMAALDFNMNMVYRDYPAVIVYHPKEGEGHDFITVGFLGYTGTFSGMSRTKLAISSIGVRYPDSSFGNSSKVGIPYPMLMRYILQFDKTVDDATTRMAMAPRTQNLIIGVGDGKLGEYRGYEYSETTIKVFDDQNLQPNEHWHPKITNTVYWAMDWICPSYSNVMSSQLRKYYGKITIQNAVKFIPSIVKTGETHVSFFDLKDMKLYVSFAGSSQNGGSPYAHSRQYVSFDAMKLLDEKMTDIFVN